MDADSEHDIPEDDADEKKIERLMDAAGFSRDRAEEIVKGRVRPLDSASAAKVINIATQTPTVSSEPVEDVAQPTLPTPPLTPEQEQARDLRGIAMVKAVGVFADQPYVKAMSKEEKKRAIDNFMKRYKQQFPEIFPEESEK